MQNSNTNTITIATSNLKPGDVIVQGGRGYNFNTQRYFDAVDRYEVVEIDEPAEVLVGIAAGQVRTDVHMRRIMSGGWLGPLRSQSCADTVTVER